MSRLSVIIIIIIVLWLIGLMVKVGGKYIHLLLALAAIAFIIKLIIKDVW